jgi:tRNA threonylcarbamoyladenosine biosynthesis protein TsaB
MILAIRTDSPVAEIRLYVSNSLVSDFKYDSGRQLAATLLLNITGLLESMGAKLSDLTGVVCYEGPGSFTGLRIGITVANSLAYSLDVPIVGSGSDDWAKIGVELLNSGAQSRMIMPVYGAEANVTM